MKVRRQRRVVVYGFELQKHISSQLSYAHNPRSQTTCYYVFRAIRFGRPSFSWLPPANALWNIISNHIISSPNEIAFAWVVFGNGWRYLSAAAAAEQQWL